MNSPIPTTLEAIIDIAYQQGASQVKGLELILRKYGMCRAITAFGMYGVTSGSDQCIDLLVRSLHSELVENLKFAINNREGTRPESNSIYDLLAGRDDMFGEYDYYVDTSHLASVVQYCPDATNLETLALIRELTHYGRPATIGDYQRLMELAKQRGDVLELRCRGNGPDRENLN